MKLTTLSAALAAVSLTSAAAFAAPICPAAGSAAAGCDSIVTINAGGSLTVTAVAGSTPYDGSDDNLVGVVNNSGATVNSISLTGSGNGGGLFAFDGDGVNQYLSPALPDNAMDMTGYGGPISYFTNLSSDQATGTINFIGGLADGASTYFSVESSIGSSTITPGPGTPGTSVTPEPGTLVLLGTGALGMATQLRRRFLA